MLVGKLRARASESSSKQFNGRKLSKKTRKLLRHNNLPLNSQIRKIIPNIKK